MSQSLKMAASKDYNEAFLDPNRWNPNENYPFELIDWEKWESLNPAPPKVYDPPQRYTYYGSALSIPLWWWNRSCYFQPLANCFISCCPCNPKKKVARISTDADDLFEQLLVPPIDSSLVPEPFRNHLFWTADNNAPETLVSFNRFAWRKQEEGGRVIGLGSARYDWTNDRTCFGCFFASLPELFGAIQVSPNGKWILLNATTYLAGSLFKSAGNYMYLYVVQEDDEFTTPDGEVIDYVKPGDLVRLSWDGSDPYQCDNSKLTYMYFPRKVATIDEETGIITKNPVHFDEMIRRATNDAGKRGETCCYCCACNMSGPERWDFQTQNINDYQIYSPAAQPPSAEIIDRAVSSGETETNDAKINSTEAEMADDPSNAEFSC